ncbi:MAG: RNA polymerase sigma-70 factor (TIGR02943 family) [Oceanospirillaceae bacterium]|jgi:RNA polymerase sigma-70 factor (TIGR02943 family)
MTAPNLVAPEFHDWTQDEAFMSELRQQMLKFATLQLQDVSIAEDAVQEAFIGALKNQQTFGRRAAFKTWVFAILKHKIIDVIRNNQRLVPSSSVQNDDDDDEPNLEIWDQQFDDRGHWHMSERPTTWQQPIESAANDQFWQVFEACLEGLPGQYSRAYMMREFIGLSTNEICEQLETSVNSLNVLLYRARSKLRKCLQTNWIDKGA